MFLLIQIHMYKYVYMCNIFTHIFMCVYIYIYIYTYIYIYIYSGKRQDFGGVLVHFIGSRLESRGGVWGGEMGSLRPARAPCLTPSSGPLADHAGTSWRSWTSSWSQDCRILSLCCRRMMPRWPNIAQDSIKMSKQWLQEGPSRPSSMPKSFQNAVLSFVF